MTPSQHSEIRDYLLSKKLPIDVLMEVEDHFVSQINDLQRVETKDFETAFEKVKNAWKPELNFPKYRIQFDLNDTTYFLKKIQMAESKSIGIQSVKITLVAFSTLFIIAYLLPENLFFYAFSSFVAVVMLVPIAQYIRYFKVFRLVKRYDNYKLTVHQDAAVLSLVSLGSFAQFLINLKMFSSMLYQTFHLTAQNPLYYAGNSLLIFLVLMNAYCFLAQRSYLNQIEKVKPYLKHLKPNN